MKAKEIAQENWKLCFKCTLPDCSDLNSSCLIRQEIIKHGTCKTSEGIRNDKRHIPYINTPSTHPKATPPINADDIRGISSAIERYYAKHMKGQVSNCSLPQGFDNYDKSDYLSD